MANMRTMDIEEIAAQLKITRETESNEKFDNCYKTTPSTKEKKRVGLISSQEINDLEQ